MPPLNANYPAIVHHMAALDGQNAPPNSLAGIRNSLEAGASFIEVDITALRTGDYLLVHYEDLQDETSGEGKVADCTPEEARRLKIKWDGAITDEPVPLLGDAIRLFQEFGGRTVFQLDFKNVIPFSEDEPIERLIDLIRPLKGRVIVSTGADWQLRKIRKLAPWLTLGFDVMLYIDWLPPGGERDPREFPKHLGAYGYYDDHMLATERLMPAADYLRDRCETFMSLVPDVSIFYLAHNFIAQSLRDGFNWADALHAGGIRLDAWTMDTTNPRAVENAPRLLEAGVDLFTSNTPKALGSLLHINLE